MLEDAIRDTQPIGNILWLVKMISAIEKTIIYSSRFRVNPESLFWKLLGRFFDFRTPTGSPTLLAKFPFVTAENIQKWKEAFGEKVEFITHFPKRPSDLKEAMKTMNNPYVVVIGSGLPDIPFFKRIVFLVQEGEFSSRDPVFCNTGRLVQ